MEDCGSFKPSVPNDPLSVDAYFTRNYGRRGSIWDVETAMRNGYAVLARDGLRRSLPDTDGDGVRDRLDNEAAFAFIVAANIVNQTWSEVLGYPLTIANYFPRNAHQLRLLWILTEFHFIPKGWSLKELLVKILTSEYFNRMPPKSAAGTTAYNLPMLFDPWVENDPRFPPEALPGWTPGGPAPTRDPSHSTSSDPERHFNAMGESVHRYSPRSLLYSVSRALDWPAPQRFPGFSYPDQELMKSIGQFSKDAEPGFRSVDFQGLLRWESLHGAGRKPTAGDDWINRLLAAIPGYDAAHPGSPLTLEDLVVTVKDWLISEPAVSTVIPVGETVNEASTLQTHFGAPLNTPAATVPMLETKLRGLCGVLLETPQFMLAGIAPPELGTRPRLRVCNGLPCNYREMCEALRPGVVRFLSGRALTCNADSVAVAEPRPLARLESICPPRLCSLVSWREDKSCLTDPLKCRRTVPVCDPRCARLDCCGGPLPPINRDGVFLAWAEGGVIQSASGVKILPNNTSRFRLLSKGSVLKAGDLLQIAPGSRLKIKTRDGVFATPSEGMPAKELAGDSTQEKNTPWIFLVTGRTVLKPLLEPRPQRQPSKQQLEKLLREEWQRWGEAGPPIPPNTKKVIDPERLAPRKQQ